MQNRSGVDPKNVILSIKPEYALSIIKGKKTIELRRKFPIENMGGGIAIIYASSPLKKIIGYASILEVRKLPIFSIWKIYKKQACVEKKFFNSYFEGLEEGFVIELKRPVELANPLESNALKKEHSFFAPQSYRYASDGILGAVRA